MDIIYSIGVKFAGGGIGNIAYHAVNGLYRHGILQKLLCGYYRETDIPNDMIQSLGLLSRGLRKAAVYDKSRRVAYWHNNLYDRWASHQIEHCDIFHGWGGFCLKTLQQAKEMGKTTIVERASTHISYQAMLLKEEYNRWGLTYRQSEATTLRAEQEFELADFILIPSDFVRKSFLEKGFPKTKLIQIPFGVDLNQFTPAKKQTNRPFRALFVGQVSLRKGIMDLLQAWQALNWKNAELLVVGQVDQEIKSLLRPYQNLTNIRWINYTPNPVQLFQQADIFVFPSIEEGSALVTYEAMACGLPIITTPNSGSIVRNEVDGIIIPIRNVEVLARSLELMRSNPQQRMNMGQAARTLVQNYSWEIYGDHLATIVNNITLNHRQ